MTLTFGDVAENNVGMQKIGQLSDEGFNLDDLRRARDWFKERGCECSLVNLCKGLPKEYQSDKDAHLLIVRNGAQAFGVDPNDLYSEQDVLKPDKKAFMRGKVKNKIARWNLCFGPKDQEPDYDNKKGTIVSYDRVPLLNKIRTQLQDMIGDKAKNLVIEGNYYYDLNKCYIGWHGDKERRKVLGLRLGATIPLYFRWYHDWEPISIPMRTILHHGDIYIMSSKAVGYDCGYSSKVTLRHAAGNPKLIPI